VKRPSHASALHCMDRAGPGYTAYARGELRSAIAAADEAAALARSRGQQRSEAMALVNGGLFRLWSGDFAEALHALDATQAALDDPAGPLGPGDAALCFAARGLLWALRGNSALAERHFAEGLRAAEQGHETQAEAVVRALRAVSTARTDPRRAASDSFRARAELDGRADPWWRAWAVHAAAVAALASGMPSVAETTLKASLDVPGPPLERARAQLLLGEALLCQDRLAEAAAMLREAVAVFDPAGARYWAVRCYVQLSRAEPREGRRWMLQARQAGRNDPAFAFVLTDGAGLRLEAFGPGRILSGNRPLSFRSHNAERGLFLLAIAGSDGMHVEQIAESLWPGASSGHRLLLGRIRNLTWDARRGLGLHAWRLDRTGPTVRLDMTGASFDLAAARAAARGPGMETSVAELQRPVLTRWAYEDWVVEQADYNQALIAKLLTASRQSSR
jgi:tetratricopeptide (TPR) repeat protein